MSQVNEVTEIRRKKSTLHVIKQRIYRERQLWLISLPIIVWVLIFSYYPMYGLSIAFFDYHPGIDIFKSTWVGLSNFKLFIDSVDFLMVLRNTLVISGLGLLFGFPAPLILALFINELKNRRFKKLVQTVSYLPQFISWVIVASILFLILGNEGTLNQILLGLGICDRPISYLGEGKYFWVIITIANLWKSTGWTSIIYISAISGIDSQLYEAGKIDGLGRFGLVMHITIPIIFPTIALLGILGISGILNAGFEQQLLIGNVQNREYWEVLDTYAYKIGIQHGMYSYGAAVGLMKSIFGTVLLVIANTFSKKFLDTSIY